jgi:hypothetical protein
MVFNGWQRSTNTNLTYSFGTYSCVSKEYFTSGTYTLTFCGYLPSDAAEGDNIFAVAYTTGYTSTEDATWYPHATIYSKSTTISSVTFTITEE